MDGNLHILSLLVLASFTQFLNYAREFRFYSLPVAVFLEDLVFMFLNPSNCLFHLKVCF